MNKVVLESAVTCLIWPPAQSHYVFGLADGKVGVVVVVFINIVQTQHELQ